MTPLREWEFACSQAAACTITGCRTCRRDVRKAAVRLALSACAYTLVALAAIAVIATALVLITGALAPAPAPVHNIQLPTR